MWILTWILDNWRAVFFATVIVLVMALWMRLEMVTAQRDEKIAEIDFMKREADAFNERSKQTAKETSDGFTLLVEQIKDKDTALKNARAKFGSCNVARGLGPVGMLPAKHSDGQADSASGADESLFAERVAVSREFIDACATDAGINDLWKQWAVKNELPVE